MAHRQEEEEGQTEKRERKKKGVENMNSCFDDLIVQGKKKGTENWPAFRASTQHVNA